MLQDMQDAKPKPETHHAMQPTSTAADRLRAAVLVMTMQLPASEVRRQPAYLPKRVAWMRKLLPLLAKDGDALLDAPLTPALTKDELVHFPVLVTLLDEGVAARDATTGAPTLSERDAKELLTLRAHQERVDRALRVHFRGDSATLRTLADIRRGEADDPADMLADARRLVGIADSDANRDWFGRLKKGEPQSVAALKTAIPSLEALVTRVAAAGGDRVSRDRFRRVCTLALRTADRIVAAGRYHTADLPGREEDYAYFSRPTVRKPRKKS